MPADLRSDPRIDPRIKALFADMPVDRRSNVGSRAEILAEEASEFGQAVAAAQIAWADTLDNEEIAPSTGLRTSTYRLQSSPDDNWINISFIRPDTNERLPCVYYIHGGGMAAMSCFNGMYQAWGKIIAARGVAVAMIDFRNCVRPSSVPEVAPYPAGLDDCVSGLRWLHTHSDELNIEPSRIVVAGESGGGNLALATGMRLKRDGELGLLRGIYALCPFIAGEWPQERFPSSIENNGLVLDLHNNHSALAYGIEAYHARDPLAWPGFSTVDDVRGLLPVVISVNECDPLRDEGIWFYRLMLKAGVSARCRQIMGTTHGAEVFLCCPDISRDTASDIANFCRGDG
jgi:acetyl esterase